MTEIVFNQIALPYDRPEEEALAVAAGRLKQEGLHAERLSVCRRSVDARRQSIRFVYAVSALLDAEPGGDLLTRMGAVPAALPFVPVPEPHVKPGRPAVVGFGPCGMFAALVLAENGCPPLVLERGGSIAERTEAVKRFNEGGPLDPECNVQFGAGGAGTFSDGKLTTRINDPACRYILETFVRFGAPEEILREGKPHIGTDVLRRVVENIARHITGLGGEIRWHTRFEGVIRGEGGRLCGVKTSAGDAEAAALFLAAGHSARDTYDVLRRDGFEVLPKAFSVGVRIEQLQADIDRAVYGRYAGDSRLPAADYGFSYREGEGKAVYTFCMCPGGHVIAAASEEGTVVTNGMSDRARDGVNANAALVVSAAPPSPVEFQRSLEKGTYRLGGGDYSAPVQTVGGFLDGRLGDEPRRILPGYTRGSWRTARLDSLFGDEITAMLRTGLVRFGRIMPAFAPRDAVLTGAETRTSSPFRVTRGGDFTAGACPDVYPCGEGAGYAGGIMSAAADGIRCASRYLSR